MTARRRGPPPEIERSELNMTPMIDIVFQLLIFFMLSMHFREVEGKLLSQLPRDKGAAPAPALKRELQEVRVILCAGGDTEGHRGDRAAHDRVRKPPEVCSALVDGEPVGELFQTEARPDRAAHNRSIYVALGRRVAERYRALPSARAGKDDPSRRPPVVLDADGETPYEHIIGAVNACRALGIETVEFVSNPRVEKAAPRK